MNRTILTATLALGIGILRVAGEPGTTRYTDPDTGITVVSTQLDLPYPGIWFVDASQENGWFDVYCHPTPESVELLYGRRQATARETRELRSGSSPFNQILWRAREYAGHHQGMSPPTIEDFDQPGFDASLTGWKERLYYVGSRKLLNADGTTDPELEAEILAFELAPPVNDGMHWRLYTNGHLEREQIDPWLASGYQVSIVPGRTPLQDRLAEPISSVSYTFLARLKDPQQKQITVRLRNSESNLLHEQAWNLTPAREGDRALLSNWATMRFASFPRAGMAAGGGAALHWFAAAEGLYGAEHMKSITGERARRNRRRDRQTDMFNVLGGRAAIRETLQLQGLAGAQAGEAEEAATVDVNSIEGVTVTSHPFADMLDGAEGGSLPLADVIPPDRFLAYFARPDALLRFLDAGNSFLFRTGSSTTGHSLAYDLKSRYLGQMGLSETWMRMLLEGGAVQELAIMLPDLFLIDGTEITVVARLKNPMLATAALRLIGIKNLEDRAVQQTADGSNVFWARRGDLLMVSTDEGELNRVLALHTAGGQGSLGKSAEFRYMLTQLPLDDDTAMWSYFSDPFIRRMVSPQTKIAQVRRLSARAELESLNAGMLLSRLDGHTPALTVPDLVNRQYAMAPRHAQDAKWDEATGASSSRFGRPGRLHSLLKLPVEHATPTERDAYKRYLDNYNRFWRRFFDPIAIRVNQPAEGTYQLGVFILPLLENSLYNGLREFLPSGSTMEPIQTPVIEPQPVGMLSVQIREDAWQEMVNDLTPRHHTVGGIPSAILDYLGPDAHMALADANPILGMGSGELSQIMGQLGSGMNDEMFVLPALVSLLTRPAALLVGLTDANAVRNLLRNMEGRNVGSFIDDELQASFYRMTGDDAWIYSIDLAGLMSLRLGVRVQDRFLVIQNLPMTQRLQVTGCKRAMLGGAQLSLHPEACLAQLAPLFASASEKERQAAHAGITYLFPFMASGASSIDEAAQQHAAWFGFTPVHPPPGQWQWEQGKLTSSVYGSEAHPLQPAFDPHRRAFGVFQGVTDLKVGMQFEQDGLRTSVSWRTGSAPP